MSFPTKLISVILLAALLSSSSLTITGRKLESRLSLAARLKVGEEEGASTCWDSLLELQACSGEVIMFFLNGETHLGPNCCKAITVIEHQCWPSMLGTLGITTEETNVLRGYCDAAAAATIPPPKAGLDHCYNFPRLEH